MTIYTPGPYQCLTSALPMPYRFLAPYASAAMLSQYGYNQLVHIASWGLLSTLLHFNAEMDDCAYICRGVWYVYMLTRFLQTIMF